MNDSLEVDVQEEITGFSKNKNLYNRKVWIYIWRQFESNFKVSLSGLSS